MRGDYAVSTLFNGNFDAVNDPTSFARTTISTAVPGWSFHGGGGNNSKTLMDWKDIGLATPGINNAKSYMQQLGIDSSNPNYQAHYALELESGESITHNDFIVPDWGALRFDLFAPGANSGTLDVFLTVDGQEKHLGQLNPNWPTITLDTGNAVNQLAYAKEGFETFQLDIPNDLRGKVGTLTITSNAAAPIYLDNIFFKSEHLKFGNPSEARYMPEDPNTYKTNFLLEKPQYTVSYNDSTKTPNWVSWQLNASWLGTGRNSGWSADSQLPNSWYKVPDSAYISPQTVFDEYDQLGNQVFDSSGRPELVQYQRGHMAPNADRNRNAKDEKATFVFTNALPQHPQTNKTNSPWNILEEDLRDSVRGGKELYLIAGGYGSKTQPIEGGQPGTTESVKVPLPSDNKSMQQERFISVPEYFWKVVLVLDKLGQNISDISRDTEAFAIMIPNLLRPQAVNGSNFTPYSITLPTGRNINITTLSQWEDWNTWKVNINDLEKLTGYNFFSNVPESIQEYIEGKGIPATLSSPLLASFSDTQNLLLTYSSDFGHFHLAW
jgi:DNA/RNA endonuclease G (NUC1)